MHQKALTCQAKCQLSLLFVGIFLIQYGNISHLMFITISDRQLWVSLILKENKLIITYQTEKKSNIKAWENKETLYGEKLGHRDL